MDELAQLIAGLVVDDGAAQHGHEGLGLLGRPLPGAEGGADDALAEVLVGSLEGGVESLERRGRYGNDGREEFVFGAVELHDLWCVDPGIRGDASDGGCGESVGGEAGSCGVEDGLAGGRRARAAAAARGCLRVGAGWRRGRMGGRRFGAGSGGRCRRLRGWGRRALVNRHGDESTLPMISSTEGEMVLRDGAGPGTPDAGQ